MMRMNLSRFRRRVAVSILSRKERVAVLQGEAAADACCPRGNSEYAIQNNAGCIGHAKSGRLTTAGSGKLCFVKKAASGLLVFVVSFCSQV